MEMTMTQLLFKLEKAALLKEDFQMNPCCNMLNQKDQQKLIWEIPIIQLSTGKKILQMERNLVAGQILLHGLMTEKMMNLYFDSKKWIYIPFKMFKYNI